MGRIHPADMKYALRQQRNGFIKQYGPVEGRKRWAEELQKRAEHNARFGVWFKNEDARLRFINNRLFMSADLTSEEVQFYKVYLYRLAGVGLREVGTISAPAVVEESPLWLHWREFLHLGGPDTNNPRKWEYEVGTALPFRQPDKVAEVVERIRAELQSSGIIGLTEEERRVRHRRRGYAGNRKVARSVGMPTYWPEEPCALHPQAKFQTRSGLCEKCQQIRAWIFEQYRANPRERKLALEVAELEGVLPQAKPVNQYSQAARRQIAATRRTVERAVARLEAERQEAEQQGEPDPE